MTNPQERKAEEKRRRSLRGKVRVFRKIWGPGIEEMQFEGAPYADQAVNDAELVLHELAHQTLLPPNYTFSPGRMEKNDAFFTVQKYIVNLKSPFLQDLHEIKAIAIELVVSNKIGLGLDLDELLHAARINTKMFKYRPEQEMRAHIERAKKLQGVKFRAAMIVYLFNETKRSKS